MTIQTLAERQAQPSHEPVVTKVGPGTPHLSIRSAGSSDKLRLVVEIVGVHAEFDTVDPHVANRERVRPGNRWRVLYRLIRESLYCLESLALLCNEKMISKCWRNEELNSLHRLSYSRLLASMVTYNVCTHILTVTIAPLNTTPKNCLQPNYKNDYLLWKSSANPQEQIVKYDERASKNSQITLIPFVFPPHDCFARVFCDGVVGLYHLYGFQTLENKIIKHSIKVEKQVNELHDKWQNKRIINLNRFNYSRWPWNCLRSWRPWSTSWRAAGWWPWHCCCCWHPWSSPVDRSTFIDGKLFFILERKPHRLRGTKLGHQRFSSATGIYREENSNNGFIKYLHDKQVEDFAAISVGLDGARATPGTGSKLPGVRFPLCRGVPVPGVRAFVARETLRSQPLLLLAEMWAECHWPVFDMLHVAIVITHTAGILRTSWAGFHSLNAKVCTCMPTFWHLKCTKNRQVLYVKLHCNVYNRRPTRTGTKRHALSSAQQRNCFYFGQDSDDISFDRRDFYYQVKRNLENEICRQQPCWRRNAFRQSASCLPSPSSSSSSFAGTSSDLPRIPTSRRSCVCLGPSSDRPSSSASWCSPPRDCHLHSQRIPLKRMKSISG